MQIFNNLIKPPLGARMLTTHPLAPDRVAFIFNERGGKGANTVLLNSALISNPGIIGGGGSLVNLNWAPLGLKNTNTTGSDVRIRMTTDPLVGLSACSVVMWVKIDNFNGSAGYCGAFTDNSNTSGLIFSGSDNSIRFRVNGGTDALSPSNAIPGTGGGITYVDTWIAGTYNGTTSRIYVNGVEQGNAAVSGTIGVGTPPPFDIMRYGTSESMNGTMYLCYIYSRALTPGELRQLMVSPYGMFATSRPSFTRRNAVALNDARVSQIATELISGAIITDPRVSQLATELISRIPPLNLMTGLVGHWPFNETGLDTTDALDQHGTNNLTALGGIGTSAQDPINSTPARYIEDSQAMGFLHADNADLSIGAGTDFTFIVRCKFESNTSFQTHLLSKDDNTGSAAYDFRLYFQQTSGFKFRVFDTSNSPFTTPSLIGPTSVTPGQTYFVACCYNHANTASELRVRMGTNSTDMQNAPASMPNYVRDSAGATRFIVGGKTSSSGGIDESLDGAIGPVSFWKRALTDAEIDAWVGVNGNYAAFGGVSSESRISQLVTELISLTSSDPRISQIATELISFVPPTDQRVSQLAIELISLVSSDPRVSQLTIELITAVTGIRISQIATELISLVTSDPRISQVAIELISLVEQVPRVSQLAVELISLVVSAPRVSQLSIELISLAALHERVEFFIVAG